MQEAKRILICGPPTSGKTTLAHQLEQSRPDLQIRHCDDLIEDHTWSQVSEKVSYWMEDDGPWVIEGVQVFRALRKWLQRPQLEDSPADKLIMLSNPHSPLTTKQEAMWKGMLTVWRELESQLDIEVEWIDEPTKR